MFKNIPAKTDKGLLNVVIEIPIGAQTKYEYDEERDIIVVDRFNYTAFAFPFNYGFIPQTASTDKDPLDVVVISHQPVSTGCLIECHVIGTLVTEDEEGIDPKLIAVPKPKVDPLYGNYNDVDELPSIWRDKIKHFYENYKSIEPGKWVKVSGWQGKAEAEKIVEEGMVRYTKGN